MKRIISSLLILLLLLNVMGFYGIFLGLKHSNTQSLLQRFDDNRYGDLQTVTIKVPIAIPYYPDTEFERIDGEIEHNGEFYRLVKQRYSNDTLYIVCVKDVESRNIKQALSDYVKTFTDQPFSKSHGKNIPNFIKDYVITHIIVSHASHGWSYGLTTPASVAFFSSPYLDIASPPPKA